MPAVVSTQQSRAFISDYYLAEEQECLDTLLDMCAFDTETRKRMAAIGAQFVENVRKETKPGVMEAFLAEYGLSTTEGVALMCLSEALLRVPDSVSIDALITDKISKGRWRDHLGHSDSGLINLSSYSLNTISGMLHEGGADVKDTLRSLVRRVGMPVVRSGTRIFMKELGRQFVLGQTISAAYKTAEENRSYRYSFDMLGEAALTAKDAVKYLKSYQNAIAYIAKACSDNPADLKTNPGISIKLSALHPRYEWTQKEKVMQELVPEVLKLAQSAKAANMGLTIDAEEAQRLELSLDVIEAVLSDESLHGWDGFGVVVQAYSKRAPYVLDYLYSLAESLDRNIMLRLVKGAYWDAEIKRAQVMGLKGYPVYKRKAHTDISYLACARKLHGMRDRIFPQFATHNAHSIAAILDMFEGEDTESFEFQRLHGMGESLYKVVRKQHDIACRVYAPVGVHRDLLAYLVRRLLENGANSSFVNQLYDLEIPADAVAEDPLKLIQTTPPRSIVAPVNIFGGNRVNAEGWDVTDIQQASKLLSEREAFRTSKWHAAPILADTVQFDENRKIPVSNPSNPSDIVGSVIPTNEAEVEIAFEQAENGFDSWRLRPVSERMAILYEAASMFEAKAPEFFALLCREAGKNLPDAIAEVREAVDFLRYYAQQASLLDADQRARGVFACISPWNFPLAIFTGQIAAALVVGNTVIAKPAEQTPLIAAMAVKILHKAGVPETALQLLLGDGKTVGQAVISNPKVAGVCFTGSTATAMHINKTLANGPQAPVPLIAETGGLNAMIVDSTALPEQTVRDIIASAFQSAGQRCSALRILYIQEDVKDRILEMLHGAMEALVIDNPWDLNSDIGPVIDETAKSNILNYIEAMQKKGQLVAQVKAPETGRFVAPTIVSVSGIEEMEREIFGPVLHIATYKAVDLEKVIDSITASGYGLTLGMHSRIDDRIEFIKHRAHVGNVYINRNQIGAVVGSQPFGGEGLSGTGPKAGGPHYLNVFTSRQPFVADAVRHDIDKEIEASEIKACISQLTPEDTGREMLSSAFCQAFPHLQADIRKLCGHLMQFYPDNSLMPGPVGEMNELWLKPRGTIVCTGPGEIALVLQLVQALWFKNRVVAITADTYMHRDLKRLMKIFGFGVLAGQCHASVWTELNGISAVAASGKESTHKDIQKALAMRTGPILPLIDEDIMPYRYVSERHICTDTTAAGGNVALLSAQ